MKRQFIVAPEIRLVRWVALLCLLAAVAGFVGGAMLLRPDAHQATIDALRLRTELGPEENVDVVISVFRVTAGLMFVMGVLALIAARGLHRREERGRTIALWLAILLGLWWGFGAASVAMSPWRSNTALGWTVLGTVVCAAVIRALTLPAVKRVFAQPLDMRAQRLRKKKLTRR